MKLLKRATGFAVCAFLAVCALMYALQRSFLFRPDVTRVDPASAGLVKAREVMLNPPGANRLLGWFIPPADHSKTVALYLHGNGANIARRANRLDVLSQDGSGVLAVSWRGYGGSEGSPSEAGFMTDARAALAFLKQQNIPLERTVLFGESLGTGVAVALAADTPVKAVILDSPYDSIQALAQQRYWWLPVGLLLRDPFRADLAAPKVTVPVLAVHCQNDPITPLENADKLIALLGGPHARLTVPASCHAPNFPQLAAFSGWNGAGLEGLLAILAQRAAKR